MASEKNKMPVIDVNELKSNSVERLEKIIRCRQMTEPERILFGNDDLQPDISIWAKKPLRFGAAYGA
jgi:hypothetical protein